MYYVCMCCAPFQNIFFDGLITVALSVTPAACWVWVCIYNLSTLYNKIGLMRHCKNVGH
jgi:hypothetical protein